MNIRGLMGRVGRFSLSLSLAAGIATAGCMAGVDPYEMEEDFALADERVEDPLVVFEDYDDDGRDSTPKDIHMAPVAYDGDTRDDTPPDIHY